MINIRDLCFSYKPTQPLFDNLNLRLEKGHIYGLLGKNGAGKSTLLKNMAGLAFPKSGMCTVNGANISERPVAALADLFFIAEDLYTPALTPATFAKHTGGFYPGFSREQFFEYLKTLDVDPDAVMDQQSFGQQKKAMIAFGLATNTGLLIMDEPTNGLDIPSKAQFRKLIASVFTAERYMVISTHQVRDLESLIDSVVILHQGSILVNSELDRIAASLTFGVYPDTAGMPVLYQEESLHGKHAIVKNTTGQYSKVDLELLFNAVTTGTKQITDLLKYSQNEPVL